VSLNRWVFKWRLKVRMFSHIRISASRDLNIGTTRPRNILKTQ